MDVKIHNSDAFDTMGVAGVLRTNRDIVEQTEPHPPARLGMMAGRAHSAKGGVGFACHNRVDGGNNCARCA